jgi:hypothetical protein
LIQPAWTTKTQPGRIPPSRLYRYAVSGGSAVHAKTKRATAKVRRLIHSFPVFEVSYVGLEEANRWKGNESPAGIRRPTADRRRSVKGT